MPTHQAGPHDLLTILNDELVKLKATIAHQTQMIEHLRGGAPNDPRIVSHAEDMSTCTLTNGDGIGYCYNRVDPELPTPLFTAVDMATAAADGFRDGAASRDTEIETLRNHVQSMIDQTTPLVPVPGDPMWSRRITIDELQTEAEALRKVATELRRWAMCENLHHDKRDQHEHDEPCKVLARIDAAMSKEVTP